MLVELAQQAAHNNANNDKDIPMPNITTNEVQALARIAGIEIADDRAGTAAARLGSVLEALDELPADALAAAEPAITFAPYADDASEVDDE